MNNAIKSLYKDNSVNLKRLDTDKFFLDSAECRFEGILDKTIRFVEDFQLLDAERWARFVRQFKEHTDTRNAGWKGEYWGKMMRGAAFTYSYTKNPTLYKVLTETVEDMISAAEADGRISTFTTATEFTGWDLWCRKYVLLGMQYFLEICEDDDLSQRIVNSMMRQVDCLITRLGPRSEGKIPITTATNNWCGLNSSSILEPVVRLYDITGEKRYLDFADYIVSEGGTSVGDIFEIAIANKTDPYQFPIIKAYELTSCFEGILEYYRATGIEKYRDAAVNYGRRLLETDLTIIGSAGCTHEYLDHSAARQTDTENQGIMQETCVTVTIMKFFMQLHILTGDSCFADAFETSLYNAYLGAVNTEKNIDELDPGFARHPEAVKEPLPFDSYSTLLPNVRGRGIGGLQFMPDEHYYGCCACIGSAGTGMIGKMASLLKEDGVVINLYAKGSIRTLTPSGKELSITVDTDYPANGNVKFTLDTEPEQFCLSLRIPAWSEQTCINVNGEKVEVTAGYTDITREWKKGDVVELCLDMRTRVILPPSNPKDVIFTTGKHKYKITVPTVVTESEDAKYHIAMHRGPIVLARDARLGEDPTEPVNIAYDENGVVDVKASQSARYPTIVEFKVPQKDGSEFTVTDYGSAGKIWTDVYGCWLPTRKIKYDIGKR